MMTTTTMMVMTNNRGSNNSNIMSCSDWIFMPTSQLWARKSESDMKNDDSDWVWTQSHVCGGPAMVETGSRCVLEYQD